MNHVFAADGSDSTKPKRSHRACLQCRKRKLRCVKPGNDGRACSNCSKGALPCSASVRSKNIPRAIASASTFPVFTGPTNRSPSAKQCDNTANANALPKNTPQTPQMARFVGHLNPETHLSGRTRPNSPDTCQENDHLGTWFSETVSTSSKAWPNAAECINRYLHVVREFEIPNDQVCNALSDIYFSTIHPFIPLVDEVAFKNSRRTGDTSIALLLAMLLAACRDHQAKPYLRFPSKPYSLQPREFAQKVYTNLTSLLKADAEIDKITLIQVHALMSLHCEGPAGNEAASLHLITAIHHLQVLGMHLPRADETDKSGSFSRIFWSIWSLDRLNAAYNGRPTIIHERDMAHKAQFDCSVNQQPQYISFMIWLKLTDLLDKTIAYYRPVADATSTGWEVGFPSFEELTADKNQDTPLHIIYVLEIFYHAIAILTSRYRDWNPVTASNAASTRQALSTLRMLEIVDETSLSELPALPIIPYTMTLCLSVTYRQCRAFGMATAINRAKRHLNTTHCVLEELSAQWWNAEAMAKLGRRAMARVRSTVDLNSKSFPASTAPLSTEAHIRHNELDTVLDSCTTTPRESIVCAIPQIEPFKDVPVPRPGVSEVEQSTSLTPNLNLARAQTTSDIDHDWFLLDSIPNLVYPGNGMADEIFNDVSMYDGFGSVFAAGQQDATPEL